MASAVTNVFRSGSVKHKSKKETANLDMASGRPMDLLVARGTQWKAIVKGLHAYYEGIAKAEMHEGKEILKHSDDLPLPFVAGAQFQQDGEGWQPAFYEIRTHTRTIGDLHEAISKKIEQTVVAELDNLRTEIKQHINVLHEDGVKKADIVDKERAHSTDALSKLGHSIATVGQLHGQNPTAAEDPYIAHSAVERQLAVQVQRENELQTSTLRHQADAERLEKDWSARIQKASADFAQIQAEYTEQLRQADDGIAKAIASVVPENEWAALTGAESNYLIPTDAPLRDVNAITFPSQGHESAQAIKTGSLERKTKFTKKYEEVFVVLTAGGFLHAYDKDPTTLSRQDDPKSITHPTLSLYLPNCALGAPAPASLSKHKFGISGIKSATEKNSRFKLGGKKDKDYTFRARSQAEMLAWHGAIAQLSGTTLTADTSSSSASQHRGEVPSTVSEVGLSHDGDVIDSSEEEEEEAFVEAPVGAAAVSGGEHALPGYAGNGAAVPVEKKVPFDGPSHHVAGTSGSSALDSYPLSAPIAGEHYGAPSQDAKLASTSMHVPAGATVTITPDTVSDSTQHHATFGGVSGAPIGAALVEPEGVVAQGSGRTI